MKRKITVLLLLVIPLCYSANAKSKVFRGADAKLDDFLKVSINITSDTDDNHINPSFELKIQKLRDCSVKQLSFDLSYFFGQRQEMLYNRAYVLRLDNEDLKNLNEYGECVMVVFLEPQELEKYYVEDRVAELNEERVSYVPVYCSISY